MPRPRLFQLRNLIRDYVQTHLTANPDATAATAEADIADRLREDFAGSNWLPVLLEILAQILPLLLELFKDQTPTPRGG